MPPYECSFHVPPPPHRDRPRRRRHHRRRAAHLDEMARRRRQAASFCARDVWSFRGVEQLNVVFNLRSSMTDAVEVLVVYAVPYFRAAPRQNVFRWLYIVVGMFY